MKAHIAYVKEVKLIVSRVECLALDHFAKLQGEYYRGSTLRRWQFSCLCGRKLQPTLKSAFWIESVERTVALGPFFQVSYRWNEMTKL